MKSARATVHGAVSVVNAIATGRGATLGTSLPTTATVSATPGRGISVQSGHVTRLLTLTVQNVIPPAELAKNHISISISTHVPSGYGLKTSSSTSTAVAMACAALFNPDMDKQDILKAGVDASIKSGVSITGAYDDVCGCFYGGLNITNNATMELVKRHQIPSSLLAIIFIPTIRRRRNVRKLKNMAGILDHAWHMAGDGHYWDAMLINGLAVSYVTESDPYLLDSLMREGALAASMSGNGPAVAAIARSGTEQNLKKIFWNMDGRIIVSPLSNAEAICHEL